VSARPAPGHDADGREVDERALRAVPSLPKVLLHDHLDGGLRPQTVLDLAEEVGHELPATTADALGRWFEEAASSGTLVRYLETFDHTTAVMQTADALRRVARESALDLAADGVVYAEQRYAPEQHLAGGLTLDEVVEAVQEGFAEGEREAAERGTPIRTGTLLTAMRHADRGVEIAELTLRHLHVGGGPGVVGFDIAGAEDGFPPERHREAFDLLHAAGVPVTIHAGEAAGLASIHGAVHACSAQRVGHGVRLLEDVEGAGTPQERPGPLAAWVRDRRIPLELCPSSNVQTGAATSVAEHGISALRDLGVVVTVNTDNRLMSATTLSREMELLVREAGWTLEDLEAATVAAARAAFLPHPVREVLVEELVRPGFAAARG